ncbi:Fic family protein [Candidatus Curtissbacteria bacterium]|nr:Fic family protein [Candidatus Curtissbacteria bacterium]
MAEESPETQITLYDPQERNAFLKSAEKDPWEREIDGMHQAMHFIQQKARGALDGGLGREDLLKVHKIVMNDPFNPEKTGVLRNVPVVVRGRINGEVKLAAFEPVDVHFLSEEFNEFAAMLEDKTSTMDSEAQISEVVELSAWAHKEFIKIHPFEDGNGRTARLIVDFIFRKSRLPYIRDWGSTRHEYDEVVYRIYSENNVGLLEQFLAIKLLERLAEVRSKSLNNANDIFTRYIDQRAGECQAFLENETL